MIFPFNLLKNEFSDAENMRNWILKLFCDDCLKYFNYVLLLCRFLWLQITALCEVHAMFYRVYLVAVGPTLISEIFSIIQALAILCYQNKLYKI